MHERIIALDVGDRTCGVAITDALGYTAQPVTTLRYKSTQDLKKLFTELFKTIIDNQVKTIVIGLPINMNGSEGPQADKVRHFVTAFQKFIAQKKQDPNSWTWISWDERLSTSGAERSLIEADVSRKKRKLVIDKMAAVFILQGYLDSLS
jgi:putative Holliday junction resolvase